MDGGRAKAFESREVLQTSGDTQRRARASALARGPERLHREEARGFGAIVLSMRNLTNWPEAGRIRGIPRYVSDSRKKVLRRPKGRLRSPSYPKQCSSY